jgi:hypothetical protein
MLADLPLHGGALSVETGAHGTHGSLIRVRLSGVPAAQQAALAQAIGERLGPLPMRHEIGWD